MPKEYFIPSTTEVIFVADLYSNEYIGGAELTTDAIINCSKKNVFKLHSESLTPELVQKNTDKYWVLCNWNQSPIEGRIQLVQSGCKYSIIEYDYKYCKYRSSHLHKLKTQVDCDCHTDSYGKWVASFYRRAEHLFFMSTGQMNEYCKWFPALKSNAKVLSSAWEEKDYQVLLEIRNNRASNDKWAILKGGSWIKAQEATEAYAKSKGLDYDLIGGLPYQQFIQKLGEYKGLIFHPAGFDTCPRLVIEAKLMGLQLDLNENVQHKDEEWFRTENIDDTINYLKNSYNRFWKIINKE